MKKLTFVTILILTAFSLVSSAQYRGALGSTWNNPVSALSNQQMWNNINSDFNKRMMLKSSLRKFGCTDAQMNAMTSDGMMVALSKKTCSSSRSGGGGLSSPSTSAQKHTVTQTQPSAPPITFKPEGGRVILAQMVAGITQDKSEQKALTQLIGNSIDAFEESQRLKGAGYDLASAMSFYASVSIFLQDTKTEINPKGAEILTNALREALGPKMASISNNDKQQFYEALLSFGMLFALSAKDADANTLKQLKQTSAELSQKLIGLDVSKYRFVEDGLVSVK